VKSTRRLVVVGVLMELAYLSFYLINDSLQDVALFIAVNAATYALLAYVAFRPNGILARPSGQPSENGGLIQSEGQQDSREKNLERGTLAVILGFSVLFRLTLLFHDPIASDDIYRYVWDGRVSAAGLNPYSHPSNDPALAHLHTEDLPARISFPEMRTIYPPLAQAFFWLSITLFGDSITGMKLLLLIADLCTIIVLLRLLRLQDSRLETIVLYAWSPVPIMYLALDGHIDGVGIPLLLLSLVFAGSSRKGLAGVSLGFASLAKLYPVLVVPFLVRFGKGIHRFWPSLLSLIILGVGYVLYFEPTRGILESLLVYGTSFEFNGPVFTILLKVLQSNLHAHILSGILIVLWLVILFLMNRSLVEKTFLAFLGFFILSPTVHPWYFTWLAALIVLRWSLPVFVLLAMSNLSNLVVYQYRATGVWKDQPLLILLEYLPFFLLLLWESLRRRTTVSSKQTSSELMK